VGRVPGVLGDPFLVVAEIAREYLANPVIEKI
jgi:hypothetical protein